MIGSRQYLPIFFIHTFGTTIIKYETVAFDKVPHKRLVQKLNYYGITALLVHRIKEILSDRK